MVTSLSDPSPSPGTPSVHTCTKSSWPLIRPDMYGELQVSSAKEETAAMPKMAVTLRLETHRLPIRIMISPGPVHQAVFGQVAATQREKQLDVLERIIERVWNRGDVL